MKQLTAEQVLPGHPDKLCDQISDAVLDAYLEQDPYARVAVETMLTSEGIVLSGEVTADATVDLENVARDVLYRAGYDHDRGYSPYGTSFDCFITEQSPEISRGVTGADQGAGDQGIMFGYATKEHPTMMPLPWRMATDLAEILVDELPGFGPDGKTQVTLSSGRDGAPPSVEMVVVALQHPKDVSPVHVEVRVFDEVVYPYFLEAVDLGMVAEGDPQIIVNSAGPWTLAGPRVDTGLTGRKIIADAYGGAARHGGGAFSGKDPSKVDRSGAYAARQAARWVVSNGLAERCEVGLAYTIGRPDPVGVSVDTFGTSHVPEADIEVLVRKQFDFRPAAIVERLDLLRPIYERTSIFGHFGNPEYAWER